MMSILAHKNVTNPPGQITNRFEATLTDYINRKYSENTKISVPYPTEKNSKVS